MRKVFITIGLIIFISYSVCMMMLRSENVERQLSSDKQALQVVVETHSPVGQVLCGTHKLRKLQMEKDSVLFNDYFLCTRDPNGKLLVHFSWQHNENKYIFSSLPIEKIQFKPNFSSAEPVIRFKWRPYRHVAMDTLFQHVIYMLVICKEDDWKFKIVDTSEMFQ